MRSFFRTVTDGSAVLCVCSAPLLVHCGSEPSTLPRGSGGTEAAGGLDASASGGEVAAGGSATGGSSSGGAASGGASARSSRVLLFTKTEGFRHSSIPVGIAAVQDICAEVGCDVVATEDAAVFSDRALVDFDAVIFLNTTGDILNGVEETAFENFINQGKGFIGIHAATDTEPDWLFYNGLIGAHFSSHPAVQEARIDIESVEHAATNGLPSPWIRRDEWYNFDRSPRDDAHVLLSLDEQSYEGGTMGEDHPIAWTREVGASRVFYTALGHTEESYADPLFLAHLHGGVTWVLG